MILKVLNSALIVFVVYMAVKNGWNMLTAKPVALDLFKKWGIQKPAVIAQGAILLAASVMILFPKTFVWGNIIMAAGILLIICLQLFHKDFKGAALELPFLLLNLLIIYLQHPLKSIVQ